MRGAILAWVGKPLTLTLLFRFNKDTGLIESFCAEAGSGMVGKVA